MELTAKALLTGWSWRPDVLVVLLAFGTAYIIGWARLRRRSGRFARPWRVLAYLTGLATVGVALLSPLDTLAHLLFSAHMVQHELLIMVAPPLLLLGDPLPAIVWGLPRKLRLSVRSLLAGRAPVRRVLRAATWIPMALGVYTVNLWAWHLPVAYEAALRNDFLHDLEHLTFFGTALLFWWPLINPAPRLRGQVPFGFRIVHILAAAFQNASLGFVIVATDRVLYSFYARVPPVWGLSPLHDQAIGGGIMSEAAVMFFIPLALTIEQGLKAEERRTRLRELAALRGGKIVR